jgi:hypothetical protein
VRGTGVNDLLDLCPYPLRILNDFIRPEAHYAPTFTFHLRSAACIGLDLKGVMIAVDLDHEFTRYTGEIRKVRANGMLPAKLRPADAAVPQELPDLSLGAAAVATEVAWSIGVVIVSGHDPLI